MDQLRHIRLDEALHGAQSVQRACPQRRIVGAQEGEQRFYALRGADAAEARENRFANAGIALARHRVAQRLGSVGTIRRGAGGCPAIIVVSVREGIDAHRR